MVVPTAVLAGGWGITNTPALASDLSEGILWDYPSIGVDAGGRIIIGAVKFTGGNLDGFWVTISNDGGTTWSNAVRVSSADGNHARVVATDYRFETFIQLHDANYNPIGIDRYESTDGSNWGYMGNLAIFSAPLNRSPQNYVTSATSACPNPNQPCNCNDSDCNIANSPCSRIGYAPTIDAKGYTNGLWIVGAPINNNGWNNIYVCTADRGCGVVNSAQDDQFMAGVSVSGDSGYWVSYSTYSTLQTRNLPLIQQSLYFPPGQAPIGATTYSNIDPRKWNVECPNATCGPSSCWLMGDYCGISSNPYAGASSPFVQKNGSNSELRQTFAVDPPQKPNVENFKPNFVPYRVGTNVSVLGKQLPEGTSATGPSHHNFLILQGMKQEKMPR